MLEQLRLVLDGLVGGGWQAEPMTGGQSGGRLYRIRPAEGGCRPAEGGCCPGEGGCRPAEGRSVIVKTLRAGDVPAHLRRDYPAIAESEYRFYTELQPRLAIPAPAIYRAGRLPGGASYLVMEDLCETCSVPPEEHVWSDRELGCVMRTYGLLHGRSLRLFGEGPAPDWLAGDPRSEYRPEAVLAGLRAIGLPESEGLVRLAHRVAAALADQPPVLLFNDFYPPNVAIPAGDGPAKLFDWQLAGVGPMQVDLVNIGLLGRDRAFSQADRAGLLELYLETVAAESGRRIAAGEFRRQYRDAALLAWGVFMDRMIRAVEKARGESRPLSPWMSVLVANCLLDWREALGE